MHDTQDLDPNPLAKKQCFVVSSMLFALFFGAGNLIFPLQFMDMGSRTRKICKVLK